MPNAFISQFSHIFLFLSEYLLFPKCFVPIKWTTLSATGAIYSIIALAAAEKFPLKYKSQNYTTYNISSSQWSRLFHEIMKRSIRNPVCALTHNLQ